ncbi:coiled-coil domain-containing protein 146 isoform X3 [Chiloscyllium plagiosum]|uniref:coiled-coil domain-containing protein 146 isoform X3 n=1 Tax=Chiloscyllium plagiosum TaxID=36176 RepID=UPI001CB7E7C0|nr:coiled-coil domain-containing protein 146 isoform X3 [Chiloscyllium plagiosum]
MEPVIKTEVPTERYLPALATTTPSSLYLYGLYNFYIHTPGDMSEEEKKSEDDIDEDEEETITAVAPAVILQEEEPADVTTSPAFQCLDELFSAGKIAGTQIGHLKSKYILLHEALRRTQESEVKLLQDAKLFTAELERQRQELEKADQFPDSYDTEVNKLRQQLLHCQNELNQTEERISRQKHRTVYLQEELEMFKKDFERLPKAADFERKTKALREDCIELSREITQRKREIKTTKEELESKIEEVKNMQQELEKKQENEEHLKLDLVQLHTVPVQLAKDIQKLNRKRNNLEKAKAEIDAQYNELLGSVQQIENKCRMVEDEKLEVMKELDEKRALLDSKEQEHNQLVKTVELGKENESTLMGQRASLDLHLRYIQTEKKILSDTVVVKQREKDRELRKTKKKEKQLKSSVDALAYAEFSYEKIKAQVESFPIGGAFLERRNELENEVKSLKRKLADQLSLTEVEVNLLRKRMLEEDNLISEQRRAREEVINLTRLAQIRSDEKDQKARDLMNMQHKRERTIEELKEEKLTLQNSEKKHRHMLVSQLQKYKLKHSNSHVIRDSLRRAICKIDQVLRELGEKREGQKIKIVKLSSLINQAEEEMIQLRKKYENVVQVRNERGIHLIEREEEVCIFYEKLSIQDSLISNGDVELHSMEDEIRFLNILLKEENRQIEKVRKDVPSKHEMESNLITLQKELALYQDKVQNLEKTLVDSSCENRSRLLGGDDPSFEELSKRIEEMDLKLVRKEEQLLEKDLITDQVTRLSERINAKAINGKQDTLTLAKKVNEMQGKVKDVTRKMMAVVSELSMQQANAIQLQQDVRDKQQFLETCCLRMEQGMAPSEEFESEWLKLVDKENRHKREMEMKNKETEEEEKHLLPGGVFTTAEPRPNAYIPDGDSGLPIPRPYGKMVPFKPSEPSAHMRHYRKPVIKPIEI